MRIAFFISMLLMGMFALSGCRSMVGGSDPTIPGQIATARVEQNIDGVVSGLEILEKEDAVSSVGRLLLKAIRQAASSAKANAASINSSLEQSRARIVAEQAEAESWRAKYQVLYSSFPQRLWRFIRGFFGLLVILLVISAIAKVASFRLVGTWIGTVCTAIWKMLLAGMTLGVSLAFDLVHFLADTIVGWFAKGKEQTA